MRIHKSVMLNETINNLLFKNSGTYIDCTLGSGGHSLGLLNRLEKGILICIDSDKQSIEDFSNELEKLGFTKLENTYVKPNIKVILSNRNFSQLSEILAEQKIDKVDGIIADLGWSSDQLNQIEGLSFESPNSELDMRLDKSLAVKSSDLLNGLGTKDLSNMFSKYADIYGKDNNFLVERIIQQRKSKPFKVVSDLLPLLDKTSRNGNPKNFYAKVFQALRIAVNNEYKNLETLLHESLSYMNTNGRVLIITFHSGEANIVQEFIKSNNLKSLFNKNGEMYLVPSINELRENISSRSAKLFGYQLI